MGCGVQPIRPSFRLIVMIACPCVQGCLCARVSCPGLLRSNPCGLRTSCSRILFQRPRQPSQAWRVACAKQVGIVFWTQQEGDALPHVLRLASLYQRHRRAAACGCGISRASCCSGARGLLVPSPRGALRPRPERRVWRNLACACPRWHCLLPVGQHAVGGRGPLQGTWWHSREKRSSVVFEARVQEECSGRGTLSARAAALHIASCKCGHSMASSSAHAPRARRHSALSEHSRGGGHSHSTSSTCCSQ